MGSGIAQLCMQAGVDTVAREVTAELGERAQQRIVQFLGRSVEKGELNTAARDAAVARLTVTTDVGDLADCDLVIEAAFEDLEVKQSLFRELEQAVRPDAILATKRGWPRRLG